MMFKQLSALYVATAGFWSACTQSAVAEGKESFAPAFFGETQLRYEGAKNDVAIQRSDAITQALRVGVEAGLLPGFRILAEGEAVVAYNGAYNDGTGDRLLRPVIPNPETIELNRLQVQVSIAENAILTVGRQILAIDDQRFIGPARFRQNNQTFDAVHLSYRADSLATVQAGYIQRTNRILGGDNPNGRFNGNSYFFNTSIHTPIGRLGAFHYALDLETGPVGQRNDWFSSKTTGVRLEGRLHDDAIGLDWVASYASQSDFADSPFDYRADYWLAGVTTYAGPVRLGAAWESLGAGTGQSFQTPLGTRRKFQGLADVFLITPPDGVRDANLSLAWDAPAPNWVDILTISARHHWFDAARGDQDYGTEIDLVVKAEAFAAEWSAGFAHYSADGFASDTTRLFLNITKRF